MNTKKSFLIFIVIFVLAGGGIYVFLRQATLFGLNKGGIQEKIPAQEQVSSTTSAVFDPLNTTYFFDNEPVTLIDGKATTIVKGVKTQTVVFQTPLIGDLNGDGKNDSVLFLTQALGGTGTFYYVTAAIQTGSGAKGMNAIFIGDRITPHDVQMKTNHFTVSYLDRGITEAMVANPSIYNILEFTLEGMTLKQDAP